MTIYSRVYRVHSQYYFEMSADSHALGKNGQTIFTLSVDLGPGEGIDKLMKKAREEARRRRIPHVVHLDQ